MVAITVILAAVIGTFVLGLGDQLGDSAPQASFSVDKANSSEYINFTKDGGQSIASEDLTLSVDGDRVDKEFEPSSDWESGASKGVNVSDADLTADEYEVRIIHDPSGSAIFERNVEFD